MLAATLFALPTIKKRFDSSNGLLPLDDQAGVDKEF
jgi:hypothetical protein